MFISILEISSCLLSNSDKALSRSGKNRVMVNKVKYSKKN